MLVHSFCRWLDELIISLWHDLQAYMEWKAQDADLFKSPRANSVAGALLNLPPSEAGVPGGAPLGPPKAHNSAGPPLPPLPVLLQGDWMRRGLLAERLYHDADALLAYRCCVRAGQGFNMVAWVAILRLASHSQQEALVFHYVVYDCVTTV